MVSTTKNTVHLMIDGYEISADFTDGRNQDVSMRVKQIILSAFANSSQKKSNHTLAKLPVQGDNRDGSETCVP